VSTRSQPQDPLGVLQSTLPVVERARLVTINHDNVAQTAEKLLSLEAGALEWSELHPVGRDDAETANLILVLDAINFCFWQIPNTESPRWSVTYQGKTYDGYWALAAALRRAVERGIPLADAEFLAALTEDEMLDILAGDPSCDPLLLLRARMENLREVGQALLRRWNGSFLLAIDSAGGSAPALIEMVLHSMPSFRDVVSHGGQAVRFYKRAQILVADLHGAFGGQGPGAFHDLDTLTAFADYKVPQVLRQFGILDYTPELAQHIAAHRLIPPDSDEEIEIRAATIWGVEYLRRALDERGTSLASYEIDWRLWGLGQNLPGDVEPYHRTLTMHY
jgi:hypothetical protein